MTTFNTYYNSRFRQNINMFFSTIPDESRFHEDRSNKKLYAVQHERLTRRHNHLGFLGKEEKEYFSVALYFTILIDEVCYTYFKEDYSKFQALTNYPKLIGNCRLCCFIICIHKMFLLQVKEVEN
jgi:hypothetical protein